MHGLLLWCFHCMLYNDQRHMLSNGFAIGQRHTNQTICQNKFDFDKALNSANVINFNSKNKKFKSEL